MSAANATDPGHESYLTQNRSTTMLVSIWAVTGAACLVTIARLYVRSYMRRNLRNDDLFIILSVAAGITACAITMKAVAHGLGRHVETLSHEDQIAATTWTFIAFFPGIMSFGIPKLAVIALLVRLLSPTKPHYYFLWAMGITVQLTLLATIGMQTWVIGKKCPPFNYITLKTPDHCVAIDTLVGWCLFAGCIGMADKPQALSAFVDFYLAIYPSAVLWRLQMRRRKKAALSVALGLGVLSGAIAVYKTTHIPALADPDFPWANASLQTWTVVEGSTIVIASSIPILQPLMERVCGVNLIECRRASSTPPQRQRHADRDGRRGGGRERQAGRRPPPPMTTELLCLDTTLDDPTSPPPRPTPNGVQDSPDVVRPK